MQFKVQNLPIKVDVDLSAHTCTCRFWQVTGIPCQHACAAIAYRAHKPEDYCHGWLTIGAYKASYNYFIQATQLEHYWTYTEYEKPLPPKVKRTAGRPKKNRRKDANEEIQMTHFLSQL